MQIKPEQSREGALIITSVSPQIPNVLKAVRGAIRDGEEEGEGNIAAQGKQKRLSLTHCQINSGFFPGALVFSGECSVSPAPVTAVCSGEEMPISLGSPGLR